MPRRAWGSTSSVGSDQTENALDAHDEFRASVKAVAPKKAQLEAFLEADARKWWFWERKMSSIERIGLIAYVGFRDLVMSDRLFRLLRADFEMLESDAELSRYSTANRAKRRAALRTERAHILNSRRRWRS
jgi:hypothetical protein